MTQDEEKAALVALVAPWLPDAGVDSLSIEESCGCYSEWTTESPFYNVTFIAPRPHKETDRKLSDIVRAIEGPVMQFALQHHSFTGCWCCCGDDGDDPNKEYTDVRPSLWVRIIPARSAQAS